MQADELLALFQRGLIPGPHESEEAFLQRVQSRPPLASAEWNEVAVPLLKQYGFAMDWVPILYSSKKLLPWEGAVFWIQEDQKPCIQIRPALQTKSLWGNSRQDILRHEAIHAAREAFQEPQFEEFLAYTTSSVRWKQWLGPLFTRPWEFPLLALAVFALPLWSILSLLILTLLGGWFFYRCYLFHRVKKILPLPILLCLTDQEIRKQTIFSQNHSLRFQLIQALQRNFNK